MSEWWGVTARRRLEFLPRVLCVYATEEEARAEHDRLARKEGRSGIWKFGIAGYVEHPIPAPGIETPRQFVRQPPKPATKEFARTSEKGAIRGRRTAAGVRAR